MRPIDETERAFRQRVSASGLPVFSLVPGEFPDDFVIWDKVRPGLKRAVVVTIPRSGTHLTSRLLAGMGMIYGGLHLAPSLEPDIVEDRRERKMSPRGKLTFRRYQLPLADVFRMLGPGQFVQGHMRHTPELVAALAGCRIVYMRRELRNVAVSAMRFISSLSSAGHVFARHLDTRWIGLDDGPLKMYGYLNSFGAGLPNLRAAIEPWRHEPNAFTLEFDLLTGADRESALEHVADLARFLALPVSRKRMRRALHRAVGAETLTWTGGLSQWQALWSDAVERAFRRTVLQETVAQDGSDADMERLLDEHAAPDTRKPMSVISWNAGEEVVSRAVAVDADAEHVNLMPQVLATRLVAHGAPGKVALEAHRDSWIPDGVTIAQAGDWLSLSSLEGHDGHRHLGMPIELAEAVTAVTFSFLVRLDRSDSRLMVQAGDAQGFCNGFFDVHAMQAVQMQNAGDCRLLCARIDQVDRTAVRVSLAGLIGSLAAPYVRIYLCDSSGNLLFTGPVVLQIRQLVVSHGLEVFDFNDPAALGEPD